MRQNVKPGAGDLEGDLPICTYREAVIFLCIKVSDILAYGVGIVLVYLIGVTRGFDVNFTCHSSVLKR